MAQRLAALGTNVVLLERASGPRTYGHMIDFYGAGYEAAEAIGVLPAIQQLAYPIGAASLVDQHGRRKADVPYRQVTKALEGRLCRVMRPDLENVLRDNLPREVELRFGASVSEVAQRDDGVCVALEDGTKLDADLLVGADGIHSTVRTLVFGPPSQYLRYPGFHSAAFALEAPSIREAVGDHVVLTDAVDRQIALHALRDGRTAVCAVYRASDGGRPDDARAALRDRYAAMGWLVPEVLERCPESAKIHYDRVAQIEMPRWSDNRVVLVGDACCATSVLAGQGASLSVASAYVLAEQLRTTSSVDRALAFYERLWRPVVEEKQQTGRAATGWLFPASSSQLRIRRAAQRLTWRPLLNRFVATALAGEPTAVITMLRLGSSDSPAVP